MGALERYFLRYCWCNKLTKILTIAVSPFVALFVFAFLGTLFIIPIAILTDTQTDTAKETISQAAQVTTTQAQPEAKSAPKPTKKLAPAAQPKTGLEQVGEQAPVVEVPKPKPTTRPAAKSKGDTALYNQLDKEITAIGNRLVAVTESYKQAVLSCNIAGINYGNSQLDGLLDDLNDFNAKYNDNKNKLSQIQIQWLDAGLLAGRVISDDFGAWLDANTITGLANCF